MKQGSLCLRCECRLNAAAIQVPLGLEERHMGVMDLIRNKAFEFDGPNGVIIKEVPLSAVPEHVIKLAAEKRQELIEKVRTLGGDGALMC